MELSKLEKAVLIKMLDGDHPALRVLAEQSKVVQASKREVTGKGFFTYLEIPHFAPRLKNCHTIVISDVLARIEGLRFGAGFNLFVQDEKIHLLEGYSFDGPWSGEAEKFYLSYFPKQDRDLVDLQKCLE